MALCLYAGLPPPLATLHLASLGSPCTALCVFTIEVSPPQYRTSLSGPSLFVCSIMSKNNAERQSANSLRRPVRDGLVLKYPHVLYHPRLIKNPIVKINTVAAARTPVMNTKVATSILIVNFAKFLSIILVSICLSKKFY